MKLLGYNSPDPSRATRASAFGRVRSVRGKFKLSLTKGQLSQEKIIFGIITKTNLNFQFSRYHQLVNEINTLILEKVPQYKT